MSTLVCQKTVLENGLTVLLVPMPGVKSATSLVYVNTGSRYESDPQAGISHFLEHMVFKGTQNYPDSQTLAQAVDAVGANFNAFTSKEYTGYYVKAASKHVPLALDVLSDMLLTPVLRTEDLEREKGVIVEEINMYNDSPSRHIGDVFEQLMFAGTSMGRDIIGSKETVRATGRQDFLEYLQTWYGTGNMVLTVAGDESVVGDPALLETIRTAFSKKTEGVRQNGGKRNIGAAFLLSRQKETLRVEYKKTDQAHFIMAVPGLKRSAEEKYVAAVLATLFGGTMSSRLFTEVREKRGLCYYVRCDRDMFHDTGYFGAAAGVDPSRVEEAVKVVREELYHLADESGPRRITQAELQRAKDNLVGTSVLDLEDTESVAHFFGAKQLLLGKTETFEEMLEKINAVTLEQVVSLAKRLTNPQNKVYFAVIGPYKQPEKFAKLFE